MRTKEERSLSPSQAMFRNCMYCYFFNLLLFFFLLGITSISCHWCVYKLLLLYIFIYIYIFFFVFVLLLSSFSFKTGCSEYIQDGRNLSFHRTAVG